MVKSYDIRNDPLPSTRQRWSRNEGHTTASVTQTRDSWRTGQTPPRRFSLDVFQNLMGTAAVRIDRLLTRASILSSRIL